MFSLRSSIFRHAGQISGFPPIGRDLAHRFFVARFMRVPCIFLVYPIRGHAGDFPEIAPIMFGLLRERVAAEGIGRRSGRRWRALDIIPRLV